MSRLNPAARFSVIGVGIREGGQRSYTDMDFGFWGGGVLGVTCVTVFVGGAFGRNFGCIVRMKACIQANTTLLCRSLEYGNISIVWLCYSLRIVQRKFCWAICAVRSPVLQVHHWQSLQRSPLILVEDGLSKIN